MKYRDALRIGAVAMALVVLGVGETSAQQSERSKKRWDRIRTAAEVGGIAFGASSIVLGAVAFNPGLVGLGAASLGLGTTSLGLHTYQDFKQEYSGQGNATASTSMTNYAQAELLAAVPGRPGYFYYPSNPNQLYFDANAAAAAEPMQARIPEPARIKVLIVNKAKDGRTIRYAVSGTPYEVPPGYMQVLEAPEGSVIAYDRGDEVGTERFVLTDGAYEFRTADQGWRFYSTQANTAVARAKDAAKPAETQKPAVAVR